MHVHVPDPDPGLILFRAQVAAADNKLIPRLYLRVNPYARVTVVAEPVQEEKCLKPASKL